MLVKCDPSAQLLHRIFFWIKCHKLYKTPTIFNFGMYNDNSQGFGQQNIKIVIFYDVVLSHFLKNLRCHEFCADGSQM